MMVCCPCDELRHPAKPDIPAGLSALPRQLAGFPEYRLAMLRDIPTYAPLVGWRAREGDDLGLMLLEMGAYVLDLLGFYDERIANESYLRTAVLRPSLRKLVGLIGYQARPALAASVVLAAIADGNRPVVLPPRTGFRSDAFDSVPPQVFETEVEHVIHSLKNEWTLGPVRDRFPTPGTDVLLEPATARLARDQLVLFRWKRRLPVFNGVLELSAGTLGPFSDASDGLPFIVPIVKDPESSVQSRILEGLAKLTFQPQPVVIIPLDSLVLVPFTLEVEKLMPGRVITTERIGALDGGSYLKVDIEPVPRFDADIALNDIDVLSPSLTATPNPFVSSPVFNITHTNLTSILLDGVYPQIRVDDLVIVQHGTDLRAARVRSAVVDIQAAIVSNRTDPPATIPATIIQIEPQLPAIGAAVRGIVIHFNMVDGGKPTRVAKTHVNAADFTPPGVPTEGLVEPIPESVAKPSELLLLDAMDNGVVAGGTVNINENGKGKVQLAASPFEPALRTPVTVFGNLVRATRGESVFNEVLGSGDASQAFQSFTLGNKPLTYLNDPSAPSGRRSTLEVRVNGIKWREVASFFGAGPQNEVYIVRQNDEQDAVVTFGDGKTGARPPTGVDNITAAYRFGAGAAKPPAGAIGQLARPAEGLRRVVNPVAAGGGADADQPKAIRTNAPTSALILGRAVSVLDFEALAREFGGVINAHVEWAWDETSQGAVVKVWFISDGGDIAKIAKELRGFLIGQADPNTPLVAEEAQAQPSELIIDVEIDPRFNAQIVIEQVKQVLTNPDTGLLALENIPIGCPLFRSRIFDAVLSVEGTHSVRAMTVDGQPAPFAITVAQGRYRDFLDGLLIGGTTAS